MEEEREKNWTNIDAALNKAKSFESDIIRDAEEIRRKQYWTDI